MVSAGCFGFDSYGHDPGGSPNPMIVCHKPKFAFVHVPKTGGSSITAALGPLVYPNFSTEEKHGWQSRAHNVGGMHTGLEKLGAKRDQYFVFGFVRNPYDRMVSWYHALRVNGGREDKRAIDTAANGLDFPEFMDFFADRGNIVPQHLLRTQHDYLFPGTPAGGVDFVGRYERLLGDFAYICGRLNIPFDLPHYNESAHLDYTHYYTPAARKIVGALFGKDLEEFGYEYGD